MLSSGRVSGREFLDSVTRILVLGRWTLTAMVLVAETR